MNRLFVGLIAVMCAVTFNVYGQSRLLSSTPTSSPGITPIDVGIRTAADQISRRYMEDSRVVMLNIASPTEAFSYHVLDGLTANFRRQNIIDKREVERVRSARGLSVYSQIDESAMQEVGRALNAHLVVSGYYAAAGRYHSTVIQVFDVATGNMEVRYRMDFHDDAQVQRLLAPPAAAPAPAPAPVVAPAPAPAPVAMPAPTVPARQAGLQNGTYTFHPRPQPYQGATLQDNVYIPKIVVRGEYMSIYMTDAPAGAITRGPRGRWMEIYVNNRDVVLQDLDNPARSWNPEGGRAGSPPYYDWNNDGEAWLVFRGVTATRFSLTNNYGGVPSVFEEIILDEPDN